MMSANRVVGSGLQPPRSPKLNNSFYNPQSGYRKL